MSIAPIITEMLVIFVAGYDSMLLNLSGAAVNSHAGRLCHYVNAQIFF